MERTPEETAMNPIVIPLKDRLFEESTNNPNWIKIAASQPIIKTVIQENSKAELKFTWRGTQAWGVKIRLILASEDGTVIASSSEYSAELDENVTVRHIFGIYHDLVKKSADGLEYIVQIRFRNNAKAVVDDFKFQTNYAFVLSDDSRNERGSDHDESIDKIMAAINPTTAFDETFTNVYIYDGNGLGTYEVTNVIVLDGVEKIPRKAFDRCNDLKRLRLPMSLKEIEQKAFNDCHSLESICIPDSVKKIHDMAFCNCAELKQVQMPSSLKEIGSCAFDACKSLQSIEIPDLVTNIPYGTFRWCFKLKQVQLPSSLEEIGKEAFRTCESLKSLDIPDSVTKIPARGFQYCRKLRQV